MRLPDLVQYRFHLGHKLRFVELVIPAGEKQGVAAFSTGEKLQAVGARVEQDVISQL